MEEGGQFTRTYTSIGAKSMLDGPRQRGVGSGERMPRGPSARIRNHCLQFFWSGLTQAPWSQVSLKPIDPTCADSGAQALRLARATVRPWLPAKSARVSNLLACYALGPPASAAQYSCRREPCTGRSAWLPLGRACLSAWIEHRSGEQRSP